MVMDICSVFVLWMFFFISSLVSDMGIETSKWKTLNTVHIIFIIYDIYVRVYNLSLGLNHQLKFLVELVSWHGIRNQLDKESRVRISTTPHLKWNIQCLCTSILLAQLALMWGDVLDYITCFGVSTISLSF